MSIRFVYGNILSDANETYVAHQCNCVSVGSKGLAKALFDVYPYANTDKDRTKPSDPGTVVVCGNENAGQRLVVNMMSQLLPGKSTTARDQPNHRIQWFVQCLQAISDYARSHPDLKRSIAFPWMIGCGLAGGLWATYARLLYNFAHQFKFDVSVYRLPIEGAVSGDALKIVLMGGSRFWKKPHVIESCLRELDNGTVVVCASYDGADAMIKREANKLATQKKFEIVQFPCAWKKWGKGLTKNVNPMKMWAPGRVMLFHHNANSSRGCQAIIKMAEKRNAVICVHDGQTVIE